MRKLSDFIFSPDPIVSQVRQLHQDAEIVEPGAGYHTWYARTDVLPVEPGELRLSELHAAESEWRVSTLYGIGGGCNGCRTTFVVADLYDRQRGLPSTHVGRGDGRMMGWTPGLTLPVPVAPWNTGILPITANPGKLLLPQEVPGFLPAEGGGQHYIIGWYTKSRLVYEDHPSEYLRLPWESWPEKYQVGPRFWHFREGEYITWGEPGKPGWQYRLVPHKEFWGAGNPEIIARQGDLLVVNPDSTNTLPYRFDIGRHRPVYLDDLADTRNFPRGNETWVEWKTPFRLEHPEHAPVDVSGPEWVCIVRAPGSSRPFARDGGGD